MNQSPLKQGKPMKRTGFKRKPREEGSNKAKRAEADELWQEVVQAKYGHRCQFPGCTKRSSEAHHIVHKGGGRFSVRWEIANGIPLCRHHHDFDSQSTNKAKLQQACIIFLGSVQRYHALVRIGNTEPGPDLDETIAELKARKEDE